MDLANYKKVWKNQPEEKNKISALEIYKMTKEKSNSIVILKLFQYHLIL